MHCPNCGRSAHYDEYKHSVRCSVCDVSFKVERIVHITVAGVLDLIAQGQNVEAIKQIRLSTNLDLRGAKDLFDSMRDSVRKINF